MPEPTRLKVAVAYLGGPSQAADYLKVSPRTLRRLVAGEIEFHDGFRRDLIEALESYVTVGQHLAAAFRAEETDGNN